MFLYSNILRAAFVLILTVGIAVQVKAGFLYALNDNAFNQNRANAIYGYNVNETTGSLTLLAGFPVLTDGFGISAAQKRLTIDRLNNRLYVINGNANSHSVSAYSINPTSGALSALPFSPIVLPAIGNYFTIAVHPSGSPLLIGNTFDSSNNTTGNNSVLSYNITPTTATAAAGNPFLTGATAAPNSSGFSNDGNYFYTGGDTGTAFAGFRVNSASGVLTALAGSPFDSGSARPLGYATDMSGRIFIANLLGTNTNDDLRVFTTANGIPAPATLNPFGSRLRQITDAKLSPNQMFFVAADRVGDLVSSYQIIGQGATTLLTPVGMPVASGGTQTNALVFNSLGTFLFATNTDSRNISTYNFNSSTGALTLNNVQPANSLGAAGNITGIDYLVPSVTTAADAEISGRVVSGNRGVPYARVQLFGTNGATQTIITNPFGNFVFKKVEVGETYIISVSAKRYSFAPQIVSVNGNVAEMLFEAQ